jgi:uncharacterized protein with GYD domain
VGDNRAGLKRQRFRELACSRSGPAAGSSTVTSSLSSVLIALIFDERRKLRAPRPNNGLPVREQQMLELELVEQPPVRRLQAGAGLLRVVHQEVRDKRQPLDAGPADDAVADRERAVPREVERRLVRAQRADLARYDPAGQLVAPRVRLELAAALELVRALLDDERDEAEIPRVAAVVPAGEDRVLGLEPVRPLGRRHRVEHDALLREVVRADVVADRLAQRRPVPDPREDFLHGAERIAAARSADPLMNPRPRRRSVPSRKGGDTVFTYAGLITLTPEGRETLDKAPEYLAKFKKLIEEEGGMLEETYAIMGPWDFFALVKYPDNAAAFRALAKIGKLEVIKTETFPIEKVDVFVKSLV